MADDNGDLKIFQASNSSTSHQGAVAVRQPYVRVYGMEETNGANSRGTANFTVDEREEFLKFASDSNAYEKICSKVSPLIFGHVDVMKAVTCLLFGGSWKFLLDGVRLRGDINVLLLGDPSTAKSQTAQDNINLQTTVLSRFDLIFIVKDIRKYDQDKDMRRQSNETWEAAAIPITVRQLEAIVRLSDTLARMRLSQVANEDHILEAIRLFNTSTMDAARSGINQHINLTPEMANEIKQAEAQIKRRMGIGSHISKRRAN